MSLFGRFIPRGSTGGGMERRTLDSSAFVPPPAAGVIDDYVGVHRAMANMTVLACVRLLADTIASLPWKAYRRDAHGIPKEIRPQPALINQPFPGFDLFEWKWMVVASMALRGNSYHLVTSRDKYGYPNALLPLHPDIVHLERRPDILMWFDPLYRIMGEPAPREDIVHMRRFTLPGEPWGLSPVRQAAIAIGMGLSAEEFGYRYFKESATPSGILTTDNTDLDEEAIHHLQMNWIQSHGGRRLPAFLTGGFKWQNLAITPEECLARGTLLTMADGTRKAVEDITVGDCVIAWNGSKLVSSRVSAVGAPPIKPMVKVTTVRGRELICTADHPMLGLAKLNYPQKEPEWIPAGDLNPGQHVRVALGHLTEDVSGFYDGIAYFLGAMVGDGNIRNGKGGLRWYTEDQGVLDRMSSVVEEMGGRIVRDGPRSYGVRVGGKPGAGANSLIRAIITESGLRGLYSHEKFVPEMIMSGGPSAWRGFLSGYLDADGYVTSNDADTPRVTVNCTSRELLDGVQHLMALLGVNASVTYKPSAAGWRVMPDGIERECREQWTLNVTGIRQVQKLAIQLDLSHTERSRRLADYLSMPGSTLRRETTDPYDRVKNVEYLGDGQSVGVTIEGTHTHVTNGLISHNSQFLATRDFQRSEICIMYGIPPVLIGDTDKATAWGTGIEQIKQGAVTFTFRPWTSLIESWITSLLPRGQFVRFDYNALLRGDVETRYKTHQVAIASGFKLRNEVRAEEEMDPVHDGDILYVPSTSMPVGYTPTMTVPIGTALPGTNQPGKPSNPGTTPMPPIGGGENSPSSGSGQLNAEEFGEVETRAIRQLELTKQIRELEKQRDAARGGAKGALTRKIKELGTELEQCTDLEPRISARNGDATELDRLQAEIRGEIGGVASTSHGKPDAMLTPEEDTDD